jgi:RNA polymerase sigma-70 factor (ECF subfamily)
MAMTPEEIDDRVVRFQRGDREAFWELVLKLQQELRSFIAVLAPSPDLVEEILQATFVRTHGIIGKYEPRRTFLPWLKGIARNLLQEELRARARHSRVEGDTLQALLAEDCLADAEAGREGAISEETHLKECIGRVSPVSRQLLEHRYVERLSLKQIAQRVRKPAAAIGVALFRIREVLRRCLEAKGVHA